MSNFYVGQRVVCVDVFSRSGRPTHLVRGKTYPVLGIRKDCCSSDALLLCVGFDDHLPTVCPLCGFSYPPGEMWRMSSRFRPLDNLEEQIEAIEEEGAPVELEPEYA